MLTSQPRRRHLVSLRDLDDESLRHIVHRGAWFAANPGRQVPTLDGTVVATYFRMTSTRTRTAFSSGVARLGGSVIAFGPGDLQENTGETVADTGAVLSRMLDGLVVRTGASTRELRLFAAQERMAVINAMTADEHPTQALTDLSTILGHCGQVDGVRVLYVGEGNNSAAALALGLTRFPGVELCLCTPAGYAVDRDIVEVARGQAKTHGSSIMEVDDPARAFAGADVVYTTRWETTGTSKADPRWREAFAPLRVDEELMARHPRAVFMHDLPAHRGDEVTAAVLDGATSIAFEQAANKMYSAMAVLEWCLYGRMP